MPCQVSEGNKRRVAWHARASAILLPPTVDRDRRHQPTSTKASPRNTRPAPVVRPFSQRECLPPKALLTVRGVSWLYLDEVTHPGRNRKIALSSIITVNRTHYIAFVEIDQVFTIPRLDFVSFL